MKQFRSSVITMDEWIRLSIEKFSQGIREYCECCWCLSESKSIDDSYLTSGKRRCCRLFWLCERFFSTRPQVVGAASRGWSLRSGIQRFSNINQFRSDASLKINDSQYRI